MKINLMVVIFFILSLGLQGCELMGSERLYSEPVPTMQSPQNQSDELESTPVNPTATVQIANDQSPAPEAFTLVILHLEHGNLQNLLAAHAQIATDLGRRPFIEFSAEWCPPCRALEAGLDDPLMIEALRGVYLIRVDIDEWEGQLGGSDFRIPGIPLFYELDSHGRSTGRAISGSAWGEDIPRYMAPPLHAFFQENQ